MSDAILAFAALAQDRRLAVFQILMRAGPKGIAAGDLARDLDIPQNTMSAHLTILTQAGLIGRRKEGRFVYYAIDLERTRDLIRFLVQDCCGSKPEICSNVLFPGLDEAGRVALKKNQSC